MGSESIAHEAEDQLVGQKYRDKTTFRWLKLDVNPFLPLKIRRSALLVGYNM